MLRLRLIWFVRSCHLNEKSVLPNSKLGFLFPLAARCEYIGVLPASCFDKNSPMRSDEGIVLNGVPDSFSALTLLSRFSDTIFLNKRCESRTKKRILMEIRDEITKWNHWNHWNGNSGIPFYTPGPSGLKKKQTSRWSKVRSSCPESFLHIRSLEVLHEFSRRKFLRVHVPRHPPTEHQWDFVQILGKRWRNKWGMVMPLLAS